MYVRIFNCRTSNVLTGNTRLRFHVSIVNKDLIYHLYSIFKIYVKTEPKLIHRPFNRLIQKSHDAISFSTLKYHLFNVQSDSKNITKKCDPKLSFFKEVERPILIIFIN